MISMRHLLCPVDLSDISLRALNHAIALSTWYECALTAMFVEASTPVIDASPFEGTAPARAAQARQSRTRSEMEAFVNRSSDASGIERLVEESSSIDGAILERARTLPADLIVMGSHGRSGIKGVLLGSVTERVLRAAPCPVMVVPPRDVVAPSTIAFKHIVCAVDFSASSLAALQWALSLADEADARLLLLHVIEVPPELRLSAVAPDANLDELHAAAEAETLERLRSLVPETAAAFCSVETTVSAGAASREILKYAANQRADLVVMGARGHSAIDRFVFGSKTHEVVRGATCPVLTVR